jgi:O-antigen ligase
MQAVAMVAVLGFVFSLAPKSSYQRVFVFLAILLPANVIVDFLEPGLIYPIDTIGAVLGRAAGTFINPTIAGEGILLTFVFACAVLQKKYRTPLLLLSGMGILLTFTRAAIAAWLLIWLFMMVRRRLTALGAIAAMLVVAIPLALGSFQAYLNNRGDLDESTENLQNRLSMFSPKHLDDASARERAEVLQGGWELFLEHPVTGAGAGATDTGMTPTWPHPAGTHNQLVMLLAEYGMIGGVLWFWLLMLLMRGRYFEDRALQSAAILLFVAMTFFTHNMFDFPYWLLTFSFLTQRARQPKTSPAAFAPALRHK